MPNIRALALVAVATLTAPAAAQAASLQIVTDGFSGPLDILKYASFDPSLGTLKQVDVSIIGSVLVKGVSQLNLLPTPNGPINEPTGSGTEPGLGGITVVAEPGSLALLGFALGGVALLRRRAQGIA